MEHPSLDFQSKIYPDFPDSGFDSFFLFFFFLESFPASSIHAIALEM